ncbi:MAG: hypothetical protein AAF399_25195, partial [Bacteroidota bacterium]
MAKNQSNGVRRDSAEMFPLMAAYTAGEETQAAFCASYGLKPAGELQRLRIGPFGKLKRQD